jgi:hypothetical protein
MIKIHKLAQPKESSGLLLKKGATIKTSGLTITNKTKHDLYVAPHSRKPIKKAKTNGSNGTKSSK